MRPVSAIARACSASRQASVTSCSRFCRTRENAVPHDPRRRRRPSRALDEVDRDRHALEVKAFAQLVLDPVRVVARDEARVVDVDPDARRPRGDLGAVEQVQPLPRLRRRLSRLAQLGERVVQRRRRDPAGVLVEELGDVLEQPVEAAAGLRGDGDQRRPLPQLRLDPGPDVLDRDLGLVPLGEDDERRAARLARDVRDGEILVDDPLARVDQDERDVGPLGGLERAQLRVVLDPLALLSLAPQAGRVDELVACGRRARGSCRSRRASCRARRRRSRARRRRARSGGTTCRRSGGRGSRRGSPRRRPAPGLRRAAARRSGRAGRRCRGRAARRAGTGRRARACGTRAPRGPCAGRRSCSPARAPASSRRAGVTASSSSPGVIPCRASTTKRTRSASSIAVRACFAIDGLNGSVARSSTPPVSMSRKCLPFQSASSSLRSRVTPGVSCTTAWRVSVSRLISVDLPTFG